MWSEVAPLQPGGFSNDITVGSVGVNRSLRFISFGERHAKMLDRQEQAGMHTYKSGKGEFSISWPSRGEGDSNDDKGAKDNSIEEENN